MLPENCTMVVFGGTGDLAKRKLVPALYNLQKGAQLPPGFTLVGVGRKEKSNETYRQELAAAVEKYSASTWSDAEWAKLSPKIFYHRSDLNDSASYSLLREEAALHSLENNTAGNYLYFMAVVPKLFAPIAINLQRCDMAADGAGWRRIMIEKPFGYDLPSAVELNSSLEGAFSEDNIFRIDHYLGKEMFQNIQVIRFANTVFEPLWNNRFIDHIQIISAESEGIGDRGRYYDRAGALRDMVQSHLLQMLAVTAMEPPLKNSSDGVRSEKLKLLNSVQIWPEGNISEKMVFGQYQGYLQEKDVAPYSQTETFAAIKLAVNNERWHGVPFYLKTGKKLQDKMAKIVVQFKKPSELFWQQENGNLADASDRLYNLLTLKVQPREGVVFQFNIKKPATIDEIVPVDMDFCQPCAFLINTPEAYERLLSDAMRGDSSRFSSWREVESSWALTDEIYRVQKQSRLPVHGYKAGNSGPKAAEEMISGQGCRWWD